MRRVWCGINASDINHSAGRYLGSPKEAAAKLPFDCGFDAVGVVAATGPGAGGLQAGDAVASMSFDAFSGERASECKLA